jgi:hypothetical protein
MQLSARSVVSLLARIFGPSFYDGPRFGRGDLGRHGLIDLVSGPSPDPWRAVMLNPQPLPPRELHALTLADSHIQEVLTLDRIGTLLGGESTKRTLDRALRLVADIDEICPRWPHWPKGWPPPPPPPWQRDEQMTLTELFVFGARFLAASELVEQGKLKDALAGLGEKALGLSMKS